MTFGFSWLQGRVVEFNHFTPTGANMLFTGAVTGSGMSDFLLGDLSSILQGLPNAYTARQNMVGVYFTDTWKISSRLTFNFGIRWDPFLPQQIKNGQISNFNMGRFLAGTKSTVFRTRLRDFTSLAIPVFRSSLRHTGNGGTSIRAEV